jgi:hypothetical protein
VGAGVKIDDGINTESISRVSFDSLRGQISGQWHLFFANTIIRLKSFYANPKPVKTLRVNHFIKVARPSANEIAAHKYAYKVFLSAVTSDLGVRDFVGHVSAPEDINDIHHGFELFKEDEPLLRAGKILAYGAHIESQRASAFANLTAQVSAAPSAATKINIDFAKHMGSVDEFDEEHESDPLLDSPPLASSSQWNSEAQPQKGTFERKQESSWSEEFSPDLLDGIPDDVVATAGVDDDEMDLAAKNLGYPSRENAKVANIVPASLKIEGSDHLQTNAFGMGEINPPEFNISSEDDISPDAMDTPHSMDQVEDTSANNANNEFDAPLSHGGGLLSRDVTISGLQAIERSAGAPQQESSMTADAVAETIARSTTYPITPPSRHPDISELEDVALRISELLGSEDDD